VRRTTDNAEGRRRRRRRRHASGNWDAELDADTSVTVDGDLVTARGPTSSARAADVLLDELED
jgi:putative intracellular protease/amidase